MSIHVQQPQPHDLVGDTVMIAGTAGGAFEAGFSYRVHEGHDEVTGSVMAGDGTGGHGQFQVTVDVSAAAFTQYTLFVEAYWASPKDGSELDRQVVPVLLGRLIVPGYTTYLEHVVRPGDTLWSIAQAQYGSGNLYHRLISANPSFTDPNRIRPGDVIRVPRDQ